MTTNPYAAPQEASVVSHDRQQFTDLPTTELKKLRNASHTIRTLGILWLLGIAVNVVLLFSLAAVPASSTGLVGMDPFGFTLMVGFTIIGSLGVWGGLKRPAWGRVMGILVCVLLMLRFPIGTLIGLLGLAAFVQGGRLFGPRALSHHDLEREWRYRKRYKVA